MQGRRPLAAEKFLDAIQVFDRDEKAIAFRVLELEVLAMRPVRLDEPHALEPRDAVVDVNHQLVGREVQGELLGHIGRLGASAPTARRTAQPAEQLRVRGEVEADAWLRCAGRYVQVRVQKRGPQL